MGEAKRRAVEIAKLKAWRTGLTPEELAVALVAERLDDRLVRGMRFSEGCYHLAFFMTEYLAQKGIHVIPVIGWVNDGTWEGVTSHAWIEYQGKKTDTSLTFTSHPDAQPTGALIIHDRVVRRGMADYTYYANDDPKAQAALEWMRRVPEYESVLRHKEAQHKQMLDIAAGEEFAAYLEMAPAGARYLDLANLIA